MNLIGIGEAGLWSLLAAGFADVKNVIVDAAEFDLRYDIDGNAVFLETLPIPNIRQVGDFRTAGTLIAPRPLTIHNTGEAFDTAWIAEVYGNIGVRQHLLVEKNRLSDAEIVAWVTTG